MTLVTAATDGSAINNPHGPAGWAWFISENCWSAGGFKKASNQVAELWAVLALLRAVPREYDLLVRSDSEYTINSLSKWMPGWKRNDWTKKDGTPVANLTLMQDLDRALARRVVEFEWVRGHNNDPMNELADRICGDASRRTARGETVLTGPGWTGYNPNPVIPRVGPKKQKFQALPKPTTRKSGLDVQRRNPQWTSLEPYKPTEKPKVELCGSCGSAINALTLHCRCGSL